MTDRTVRAILKADVSSLVAGMKQAQKATDDFAKNATKSATDNKAHWQTLGQTSMVAGAAIALGVGLAVKAFADFDKEMSNVRAVSGATAAEMDKLRGAALKAGADTKFSASEAATAEAELAKAGVSTADILGGALTGSLNLAAAGGLDLANAATIAAQAMNIFKLGGKDVSHIADVLASGANKSAADVGSLGDALKQGGLVAAQTGLHLEDTVGVLSMFADSALVGSDAGTSLKTMLMRLVPSSKEAQVAMDSIGFSAYDSTGKFVGMESVAQQLKTGLGGLSAEQRALTLNTIFGSDATRAASILFDKGAAGVKSYTAAMNDNGAAARMSAIQMDNLSGDLEQLKGSIETALIQAGSGANVALRDMAQFATGAVNAFGSLPAPLQQGALGLGAVAATGLLAGGAFLTIVPKIAETKNALVALGVASKLTKANLMSVATGPVGIGLAALTVVVGLFAKSQMDAKGRADDLKASLDQQTGAITEQTRALVAKQLQEDGSLKIATRLGVSHQLLTRAALGETKAVDELRAKRDAANAVTATTIAQTTDQTGKMNLLLGQTSIFATGTEQAAATTVASNQQQAAGFDLLLGSVAPIGEALGMQTAAQKEVASAAAAAVTPAQALVKSEEDLAKAATDAKKAHDDLISSVENFGSVTLDARGAARDYQDALQGAEKALKENGKALGANGETLKNFTDKGQAAQEAIEAIATTSLKSATAGFEHGKSIKAVTQDVIAARGQFVSFATKMGMSDKAANRLATELGLTTANVTRLAEEAKKVPKTISPKVSIVGGASALTTIATVAQYLNRLKDKTITIETVRTTIDRQNSGRGVPKADGGLLTGPGTGTSDDIPVMASNGEFWVNAKETSRNLPLLHAINNGALGFANGGLVGFAQGGQVDISDILELLHAGQGAQQDSMSGAVEARSSALAGVTSGNATLRKLLGDRANTYRSTRSARANLADVLDGHSVGTGKKRHTVGPTPAQRRAAEDRLSASLDRQRKLLGGIAAAEGKVTASRHALTKATAAVTAASKAAKVSLIDSFASATTGRNKISGTFLANLTTLANRGLTTLARTLLTQGDAEAEGLAAQAVALPLSKAQALESGLKTSAATDAKIHELEDRLNGVVPEVAAPVVDPTAGMRFFAAGPAVGAGQPSTSSAVDMSGVRADLSVQTGEIRQLVKGIGAELDRQARTIQTLQRTMPGQR